MYAGRSSSSVKPLTAGTSDFDMKPNQKELMREREQATDPPMEEVPFFLLKSEKPKKW